MQRRYIDQDVCDSDQDVCDFLGYPRKQPCDSDLSLHLVLSNYKLYAHLDMREYFRGL